MTTQSTETIIYKGRKHSMRAEPLAAYFEMGGAWPENPTGIGVICSACWRGYDGTWKVINGRLYLIKLYELSELDLEAFFPGYPDRVFAHWCTGTVSFSQGKLLKYGEYESVYERDVFIRFVKGVAVETTVRVNGEADERAPGGYRLNVDDNLFDPLQKAAGLKADEAKPFVLGSRRDLADVEIEETVHDPLAAAPELPFGHLNAAWRRFKDEIPGGAKLWSYSASWAGWKYGWDTETRRHGYVAVEDGRLGPFFGSVKRFEGR